MNDEVRIGRYANVLMDRWFKRTFGWAPAKRLMQLFLQEMIPERVITELSFGPQEYVNPIEQGKDIRLDVHCTDTSGAQFAVEVQFSEQKTFFERALFNSTFVIQEQLPVGSTDWAFAQIYFIGIVNFSIHQDSNQVLFRYRLKEIHSGEDMAVPVEYLFLEVPNCSKALTHDASLLDNLCYALKNMPEMDCQPDNLQGEIFDLLFNSAEINKFAPRERAEYIKDMTTLRDITNQLATAEQKGEAKGREEEKLKIARTMLAQGFDLNTISNLTGVAGDVLL